MITACKNSVFQWIYFTSATENLILIIFNAVLIPLSTVSNALVIYSLVKTRQLSLGANKMFCFLSISDFCIAAICQLANLILLTVYRNKRNCRLEISIQYSSTFLCNLSGMIILSIAIDRYAQMRKTLRMIFRRNRRRTIYFVILSLTVALGVTVLDVLGTFLVQYSWINMSIQLGELTALVIIFSLYIMLYCSVSKYRRRTNRVLQTEGMSKHRQPNVKYARAMIGTIIMILTSLLICYFPLLIVGLHTVFKAEQDGEATPRRTFTNYLSFQFGFTSSFLSSVIFLYRNQTCRKYVLDILHKSGQTFKFGRKTDSIFMTRARQEDVIEVRTYPAS